MHTILKRVADEPRTDNGVYSPRPVLVLMDRVEQVSSLTEFHTRQFQKQEKRLCQGQSNQGLADSI